MRYSFADTTAPLAVADYTYDALPASARDAVPTDTELATAAGGVLTQLTAADRRVSLPSTPRPTTVRTTDSTRH